MLNGILKGLFQWLYGLFLDLIAYCANALLGVMSTDLTYFERSVPIVGSMREVFLAVGWALLLGNLVFQAMKSMLSGLGFEGESPAALFARTFTFGFLLLASRQICDVGLGISSKVISLLGVPAQVTLTAPDESYFSGDAAWVLVIIIGVILGIQLVKLFFEIGERYVVVCVLTYMSPLGFAMGGSKATKEIFTGYIRMYASMLLMMVMNVVFLKLILSALATMPSGVMVLPWCVLVVAIARVARKVDNIISKIGLNPAITGDPLGRRGVGMTTILAARTLMKTAANAKSGAKGGGSRSSSSSYGGSSYSRSSSAAGGTTFGGGKQNVGGSTAKTDAPNTANTNVGAQNSQTGQTSQNNRFAVNSGTQANQSNRSSANTGAQTGQRTNTGGGQSTQNTRGTSVTIRSQSIVSSQLAGGVVDSGIKSGSGASGGSKVNTNRFGSSAKPPAVKPPAKPGAKPAAMKPAATPPKTKPSQSAPKKPASPSAGKTRGIQTNAKPVPGKPSSPKNQAQKPSTSAKAPRPAKEGKNMAAPAAAPETKADTTGKKQVDINIYKEADDE